MRIGRYTFEEFFEKAREFHGYPAPGVMAGAYMVEAAKARLPEGTLFEALCETPKCLPDAVQLLTLCTYGNGRLRALHLGRFALALYDKFTGEGFRVSLDIAAMERFPEFKAWFLKTTPKREQDSNALYADIRRAGDSCCVIRPVRVQPYIFEKSAMGTLALCPVCNERYPAADGLVCRACRGEAPYVVSEGIVSGGVTVETQQMGRHS